MWITAAKQSSNVGSSMYTAGERKKSMMELDQTSPFKRLTESQYLLSKAGHEEARQEGRLRPPSLLRWQKMLRSSLQTTIQTFGYKKSVIFFFFFPRKDRVRMILIAPQQISENAHPFSVSCCHAHVERNDKKQLVRTFANDRHPRHSSPIHHLAIRWGVQICNTQWSDLWQAAAARVNSVPCGLFQAL